MGRWAHQGSPTPFWVPHSQTVAVQPPRAPRRREAGPSTTSGLSFPGLVGTGLPWWLNLGAGESVEPRKSSKPQTLWRAASALTEPYRDRAGRGPPSQQKVGLQAVGMWPLSVWPPLFSLQSWVSVLKCVCVWGRWFSMPLATGGIAPMALGYSPLSSKAPRGLRGCQGSLLPLLPPTTPARGTPARPKACARACAPDDTITAHNTPYVLCF